MWKFFVIGLMILLADGSSSLFAQQAPTAQQAATSGSRFQWSAKDAAAFSDARIAALKAGLELKAEQQKVWSSFETAFRDFAKQEADRISHVRSEPPPADPFAMMRRRADSMKAAAAALKQLADITEPLYRSLDDSQKRRMVALMSGPGR